MTVFPTVEVSVYVRDSEGNAIANATVCAFLSSVERYSGVIIPLVVSTNSDQNGLAVLNLFPNDLGSEGSFYKILIAPSENVTYTINAVIPNEDCNIEDCATVTGDIRNISASTLGLFYRYLLEAKNFGGAFDSGSLKLDEETDTIDLTKFNDPFTYDVSTGCRVFLDGIKQEKEKLVFQDSRTVKLDEAFPEGTLVEVESSITQATPFIKGVGVKLSGFGSIGTAIQNISSDKLDLIIDKEETLVSDVTVPENVNLVFARGGKLSGNYTLTIDGGIDAGLFQIFGSDLSVNGSPKIEAVYPEWFGAVGDGIADDTVAIQRTGIFCKESSVILRMYNKTYVITDTLDLYDISISGCNEQTILKYEGEKKEVILNIGGSSSGTIAFYKIIENLKVIYEPTDWSLDFIGILARNFQHSIFRNIYVYGTGVGFAALGESAGFSYNSFFRYSSYRNKYGLLLLTYNNQTIGWVNENAWYSCCFRNSSSDIAKGDGYGVVFDRKTVDSYNSHNNNRFLDCNFEIGPIDGTIERIPFLFNECGAYNTCERARHENNGSVFAKIIFSSSVPKYNDLSASLATGSIDGIKLVNGSNENFYNKANLKYSLDINPGSLIKGFDDGVVKVYEPLSVTKSNGLKYDTSSYVSIIKNGVKCFGSDTLSFELKVRQYKQYIVNITKLYNSGRTILLAFDTEGDQIINPSEHVVYGSAYESTSYGGCLITGTDGVLNSIININSDEVDYVRVLIRDGSFSNISVLSDDKDAYIVGNTNPQTPISEVSCDPNNLTSGFYGVGSIVYNSDSAVFYKATVGGYKAPDRIASNSYTKFQLISYDGSIYYCYTSGETSSSPTIDTSGDIIVDGTCEWKLEGDEAIFSLM